MLSNSSTLSIACTTVLHWAYLSEPLVKESQTSKFDGKPHTACSGQLYTITVTYLLWRGIWKNYTWRKWL